MYSKFYLQDSRDYVGNDMLFWKDGGGYTTDISKAEVMTEEVAFSCNKNRESDIPWPKQYIDGKTRPAVDMQYVNNREALCDINRKLHVAPKPNKQVFTCPCCGKFVSDYDSRHFADCPHCGKYMHS